MAPRPKTGAEPTFVSPTGLGRVLQQLLKERDASGRQVSLAAGLSQDTIRNLIDGKSANPRQSTLDAIGGILKVSAHEILKRAEEENLRAAGKLPAPAEAAPPPPVSPEPAKAPQKPAERVYLDDDDPKNIEVPNRLRRHYRLERLGLGGSPEPGSGWMVDPDFPASIGAGGQTLQLAVAPTDLGDIKTGDWLIVARAHSIMQGLAIVRLGDTHALAHVLALPGQKPRLKLGDEQVEMEPGSYEVVAKVIRYLARP